MNHQLKKPLLMLAPMAGYSDLPFRSLVKNFGVDITVSEMISVNALAYANAKTLKMTEASKDEVPFSLQIAGHDLEVIKKALEKIEALEHVDIIDFNCGCPAPKVTTHGNGSALLKDLESFVKILRFIRANSSKKLFSVKVRLGFDKKIPKEIAEAINESGVDFCVVHARTKVDAYKKERIDYESLALMKEIVRVPLVANGEINTLEDYKKVISLTKADGAMIGRGALKAPWLFYQIRNDSFEVPDLVLKNIVLKHFEEMYRFYGDFGVIMFRKNLHAYTKGLPNASEYRDFVNRTKDYKILKDSIESFFNTALKLEA
ncbi:tRNA dihydrouridine synthase DusB [Helicobacter sp. 13S00401-1]|uniref:tRNA dihydrouridine synthase n=1 Tax=Helicobacter sp. 13S00401-1 TaxID=1905758 RepID=UPI000BD241C3|nr:tRNA-dihydrouridine synthase [Helicobacter sp. 13S00401-1]PAF48217.1 tRNA dihydrouridine synthase DusB [Helicobacter sp. 13S00401-1]